MLVTITLINIVCTKFCYLQRNTPEINSGLFSILEQEIHLLNHIISPVFTLILDI